ncbi:MAG: RecX family transcriptional regulator [Anaerolineae bacterium]
MADCFLGDASLGEGIITALQVQKRDKQRVNVYIDGEFAFGLSLIEAARLRKGQALSETEISTLRNEDEIQRAVDSAANFLSYRPRSVQEVRRNLTDKELPADVVEVAVSRLITMGYLNDEAFARYWVQNRDEFKPLSQRALRQELRQKGVADAVITEALAEQDEFELAYRAASGQLRKLRGRTMREFKTKLGAFLQRRGFMYSTIQDVVVRIIEELGADDRDYFNRAITDDED